MNEQILLIKAVLEKNIIKVKKFQKYIRQL